MKKRTPNEDPSDDHAILLMLAVAATGMARSHLSVCLRATGARRADDRGFSSETIGRILEGLARRGLIDYTTTYARIAPEAGWALLLGAPRASLTPIIAALRAQFPHLPNHRDTLRRELHLALLDHDAEALVKLIAWTRLHHPFALSSKQAGLFEDLPKSAYEHARKAPRVLAILLADSARCARRDLQRADAALDELEVLARDEDCPLIAVHELVRHLVLRQRHDEAAKVLSRTASSDFTSASLVCWNAVARGAPVSDDVLTRALAAAPQSNTEAISTSTLPGPERLIVALLRLAKRWPAERHAISDAHGLVGGAREYLQAIECLLREGALPRVHTASYLHVGETQERDAWRQLCERLARALAPDAESWPMMPTCEPAAQAGGYPWLAAMLGDASAAPPRALQAHFALAPPWERALKRLETSVAALLPVAPVKSTPDKRLDAPDTRLVWMLEAATYGIQVHPREQKRDARYQWSKGRRVALERLHGARPSYKPLTEADRAVCSHVREDVHIVSGYRNVSYSLDGAEAYPALAAHPHVFWLDDDAQRVAFRDAEPILRVARTADQLELRFEPRVRAAGDLLSKTGAYEVTRVRAGAVHEALGKIIGAGVQLPLSQTSRVERLIAEVAGRVAVHSDLAVSAQAERVTPDCRTVVRLTPVADGLTVRMCVRPLGEGGAALVPGQGAGTVSGMRDGRAVVAERDPKEELARADEVIARCPALNAGEATAEGDWKIADTAASLELLLQLEARGDSIVVEWPAGKPLKVVGTADASTLRLKVGASTGGWFALTGELVIADQHTLEIAELLRLVADSPSRFVALSPGSFVALTADFQHRLSALATLVEPRRGHLGLHPWAGGALDAIAREAGQLEAIPAWRKNVAARAEAERFAPIVPETFKATLRDYQRDGFVWLARLAQLGAGACLADDMGLGKTLQTLALLVHRAPSGPQLVVCPSSVVGGWLEEAARFAPTLNLSVFGAGDRARAIADAGPFDVLVVSYGLLPVEAEALAGRRWETVVLDEAQAIKNADTQRASAAYRLDAGFRVALTGTPIENRLEDLWAIFHFVLPGFLGTRARFVERFVSAEPESRARQAGHALKQVVQPLLLRRTKGEVLNELPARTEIVLRVVPGGREAALYEALRQRALTSLEAHAAEPSGQRRVRVLAEITRLRRACCHPRLVLKEEADGTAFERSEGAKLEALSELVRELREGGHRALIYSQFVDHLQLVREWLDEERIDYQYLDGSTPQKQRQERVRAFQAGQGELFLISLRAGGTGLNLTGADFVVHLDPWWNPAVEDQASDRIYRIGQERPVTIVRLVVRGSIEERIMELHRTKRELADDLLAGADAAGKLDTDGLIALLAGAA